MKLLLTDIDPNSNNDENLIIDISDNFAHLSPFIIKAYNDFGCNDNIPIPVPMSLQSYEFIKKIETLVIENDMTHTNNNFEQNHTLINSYFEQYNYKQLVEFLICTSYLKITKTYNIIIEYLIKHYEKNLIDDDLIQNTKEINISFGKLESNSNKKFESNSNKKLELGDKGKEPI